MGINRDPQHLLDNAEQNIGNSAVIQPQVGPGGPLSTGGTITPQTNPARLLQLTGPSQKGQTTSVIMTAARIVGAQNPNPGYPGPITGIIEFGSGGRGTKVEFDIPVGPFIGQLQQAAPASEPQDGGVIITVPTSVLRAYARYDNLLIASPLNTGAATSLAQIQGAVLIGPGGPVSFPSGLVVPAEPIMTKAMAAYFSRHTSQVYKTLYLYVAELAPAFVSVTVASNLAPAAIGYVYYALPAFTRSVKVMRMPLTSTLTCVLHNGVNEVDQYTIAAGSSAPIIPITGGVNIIGIQSATRNGPDQVDHLALVCEIGI